MHVTVAAWHFAFSPWRGAVACGAALLAFTGCGWMNSDPVHSQWESRTSLPSCGSLELLQGEQTEVDAKQEAKCLQDALESERGAELTVTSPTIEGDPITTYYRVMADGSTEVYTDSTQDEYGSGGWSFSSCKQPETALQVNC